MFFRADVAFIIQYGKANMCRYDLILLEARFVQSWFLKIQLNQNSRRDEENIIRGKAILLLVVRYSSEQKEASVYVVNQLKI